MIRLEEFAIETLETVAPQLHFLLKTRIYLDWLQISESGEEIFWKKLRRALGFTSYGPYGTVKQYYQNYWFKKNSADRIRSRLRAITSRESPDASGTETTGKRVESRDFLVPSIAIAQPQDPEAGEKPILQKERAAKNSSIIFSRRRATGMLETCIRMKDLEMRVEGEEEGASETGSKVSVPEDSAISSGGMTSRTMSTDEDDVDEEDEEAVFGDIEDEESTSGCESSTSSLHRDRMTRRKIAISMMAAALHADQNNNLCVASDTGVGGLEPLQTVTRKAASKRAHDAERKLQIPIIEEG